MTEESFTRTVTYGRAASGRPSVMMLEKMTYPHIKDKARDRKMAELPET